MIGHQDDRRLTETERSVQRCDTRWILSHASLDDIDFIRHPAGTVIAPKDHASHLSCDGSLLG